jgi:hypothetical protein
MELSESQRLNKLFQEICDFIAEITAGDYIDVFIDYFMGEGSYVFFLDQDMIELSQQEIFEDGFTFCEEVEAATCRGSDVYCIKSDIVEMYVCGIEGSIFEVLTEQFEELRKVLPELFNETEELDED